MAGFFVLAIYFVCTNIVVGVTGESDKSAKSNDILRLAVSISIGLNWLRV